MIAAAVSAVPKDVKAKRLEKENVFSSSVPDLKECAFEYELEMLMLDG